MKCLPRYAFVNDILYIQPREQSPADPDSPWYEEQPVGKNTLLNMMKDMSAKSGIAKKTASNAHFWTKELPLHW